MPQGGTDYWYMGDAQPKLLLGWNNNFTYMLQSKNKQTGDYLSVTPRYTLNSMLDWQATQDLSLQASVAWYGQQTPKKYDYHGDRVTGSIDADNAGNRYTGEYRLGATVNLNNPAGLGDVASLRVMTTGSGLNYARASYQMQFGKATAGVAYSWLGYELGKEFKFAQATGTARVSAGRVSRIFTAIPASWSQG